MYLEHSPTFSATQLTKAMTSCWVVCSISHTRSTSKAALALISARPPQGSCRSWSRPRTRPTPPGARPACGPLRSRWPPSRGWSSVRSSAPPRRRARRTPRHRRPPARAPPAPAVSPATRRIFAARMAALRAPLMATVATGTPGGICTMESSESSPPRSEVRMGTPITGRSVMRGHHPGKRRRLARARDDHLHPPRLGAEGVFAHAFGVAMGREHVHLVRDPPGFQFVGRLVHDFAVGLRAHQDAHQRLSTYHPLSLEPAPAAPFSLRRSRHRFSHSSARRAISERCCSPSKADRRDSLIGTRPCLGEESPKPVTVSTRPPAVTSLPSARPVAAWNTWTHPSPRPFHPGDRRPLSSSTPDSPARP